MEVAQPEAISGSYNYHWLHLLQELDGCLSKGLLKPNSFQCVTGSSWIWKHTAVQWEEVQMGMSWIWKLVILLPWSWPAGRLPVQLQEPISCRLAEIVPKRKFARGEWILREADLHLSLTRLGGARLKSKILLKYALVGSTEPESEKHQSHISAGYWAQRHVSRETGVSNKSIS